MDAAQTMSAVVSLHALVTDLAAVTALAESHRANGNSAAVEGCRQSARSALRVLRERLDELETIYKG